MTTASNQVHDNASAVLASLTEHHPVEHKRLFKAQEPFDVAALWVDRYVPLDPGLGGEPECPQVRIVGVITDGGVERRVPGVLRFVRNRWA